MNNRWPAAGDICQGTIYWCRTITPTIRAPFCVGVVAANSQDWPFVSADLAFRPLQFEFWSLSELFFGNQEIVFEVAQGPYDLFATNVTDANDPDGLIAFLVKFTTTRAPEFVDRLQRLAELHRDL
jgi:hypothetical protein